jgi:hypothetical protein
VTIDEKVLKQVAGGLGNYVYMLVDPRERTPFYVGKGRRLRFDSHYAGALVPVDDGEDDAATISAKIRRIREIIAEGAEPEVWIIRYGLNDSEYTAVEAAVIDLLMSMTVLPLPMAPLQGGGLTNARREKARGHGIRLLQSIIDEQAAPELTSAEPLLLITLNGQIVDPDNQPVNGRMRTFAGYRPEWRESAIRVQSYSEIGESVCAWWSINPRTVEKKGIRHVVAVHEGVTRALFEIVEGSWDFAAPRTATNGRTINDVAFAVNPVTTGPLFDEVVGPHGHRLPMKSAQNAIRYWPVAAPPR